MTIFCGGFDFLKLINNYILWDKYVSTQRASKRIWPNLSGFSLLYPQDPPYIPTELPTVGFYGPSTCGLYKKSLCTVSLPLDYDWLWLWLWLWLRLQIVHRVSSSLLGPVVPSFRALHGRLKFTVRRHKFNKDSLLWLWLWLVVIERLGQPCSNSSQKTRARPNSANKTTARPRWWIYLTLLDLGPAQTQPQWGGVYVAAVLVSIKVSCQGRDRAESVWFGFIWSIV